MGARRKNHDGGFGGHLMGGGEFGASAREATKDLLHIFVLVIYIFSLSVWKVKLFSLSVWKVKVVL